MKRETGKEKEAREKADLYRLVEAIVWGAHGAYAINYGEDSPGLACEMGLEGFGRFIGALERHLLRDCEQDWQKRVRPEDLHELDSLDSAALFLWKRGVRVS